MSNSYENRRQRIMARLVAGDSILDVGCAQRPNPYLKGKHVIGLDLADMEIRPPYTDHIVGDIADIEALLAGQQFDTVLMGEFIEHIERPYDVLRSFHKNIKHGGSLILSTPNPLGIPVVLTEYLCLRKYFYTDDHVFYFSPRWVWRLLERTGYKVIRTVGCGISLGGFWLPSPVSLSYIVIYEAKPV